MSTLPKKNRVLAALQKDARRKRPPPPLDRESLNIPVGVEACAELMNAAKEVHQHNVIRHLVMLVQDDESLDCCCLFCGGVTKIRKPYAPAEQLDNDVFLLFKQLHVGCEVPQKPVGFFNCDSREKRNPLFVNKGTGVTVELRDVKVNVAAGTEIYHFVDLHDPKEVLTMPKEEFMKFFELVKGAQ
jgi:hypothetical protein